MTTKTTNRRRSTAAAIIATTKLTQEPMTDAAGQAFHASADTSVRKTKSALLRDLLSAPRGASLASLMAATGWQAHTVRAALSGLRKGGTDVTRTSGDDGPVYAISAANAIAKAADPAVTAVTDAHVVRSRGRAKKTARVPSLETDSLDATGAGRSTAAASEPIDVVVDGIAPTPSAPPPAAQDATGGQP